MIGRFFRWGLIVSLLLIGCDQDAGVDRVRYLCGSDSECGEGFYCHEPASGDGYCVADGESADAANTTDTAATDTGEPLDEVVSLELIGDGLTITEVIASPDGDFLVTGVYKDSLTVGDTSINSLGARDGFALLVDAAGQVQWLRSLGSASEFGGYGDFLAAAAFDGDGNLLLGGNSFDGLTYAGNDIVARTSPEPASVQSYILSTQPNEPNSQPNWRHIFGTAGDDINAETDSVTGIAPLSNGHTVIGGSFEGCLYRLPQDDLEKECPVYAGGPIDGFFMVLDDSGVERRRAIFSSEGFATVSHVGADDGPRIGFAAEFQQDATIRVGASQTSYESQSTRSAKKNRLLGELDAAGELAWAYVAGLSDDLVITELAYTPSGMLVAGQFGNDVSFGNQTPTPSQISKDGFLTQLDGSGNPNWFVSLKGEWGGEAVYSVQVDGDNRIIAGLRYTGEAQLKTTQFDGEDGIDSAVAALDENGQLLWSENFAYDGKSAIFGAAAAGGRVAAVFDFEKQVEFRDTPISDADGGMHLVIFDESSP
ncbi:MAG: hypothetical protein ACLFVJ_19370 [Persicimonas sp.]